MPEVRLFVEIQSNISGRCIISDSTSKELGISQNSMGRLTDPSTQQSFTCPIDVSPDVLEFQIRCAPDLLNQIGFKGIELIIEPAGLTQFPAAPQPNPMEQFNSQKPTPTQPSFPNVQPPPKPQPTPYSTPASPTTQIPPPPQPTRSQFPTTVPPPPSSIPPPPVRPQIQPNIPPPPSNVQPQYNPPNTQPTVPPPPTSYPSQPSTGVPPPPSYQQPNRPQPPPGQYPSQPYGTPAQPGYAQPLAQPVPDPYPNKIDVTMLSSQKPGSAILKVTTTIGCEGRVKLHPLTLSRLGLAAGMLIAWEDPLTRSTGSARITLADNILSDEMHMDLDTSEDTNIKAERVVVYSTEPPIVHQEVITLEVISQPDLNGFIMVNPRNAATLQVKEGDVLAFEDNLTGAVGAAKFKIMENLGNSDVIVDEELLEASGVGSLEVELKKNIREIIPLQSIELGISPITGENIWEIISAARQNINSIKSWLSSYIIFKGIKLRWKAANVACEILTTTPDLIGDVFASITPNTTLTLKPVGLVTFNAILVIDISRSMMARDVEVKNIGPALEGIKAAMRAKEIQDFLSKFKPGINVPRRYSAAFAAILFLSEKVGRGFGEKVSIIRFADEAQLLYFSGGLPYMDSSSGEKDILENCAKLIVEQIGMAYGQSTNMGLAMQKAEEITQTFDAESEEQIPTMIVLLTDGAATDGDKFFQAIQKFSQNPNVVIYIIGLGNPDDQQMKHAAALCGGEYFKPQDAGELLVWYSKRARDLQVKLKGTK